MAMWLGALGVLFTGSARAQTGWVRPPELQVAPPPRVTDAQTLIEAALGYLGHPYARGGNGRPAFDCSGFVCRVYAESGWALPRVSRDQRRAGRPVERSALRPGDLVFFAEPGAPVSHVAIYLGEGAIVHASTGRGEVSIADLDGRWFRTRYAGARRVLTSTPTAVLPEIVARERVEHRGASSLLPMVDRPPRFRSPRLGVRLAHLPGSGGRVGAMVASEAGRVAPMLVPELSFFHRPWGLELILAAPIRFEPEPTVGPVDTWQDGFKFFRRLRLGLEGARLEVALERGATLRLGRSRLLHDLSPDLAAAGLPGFGTTAPPLSGFAAWRPSRGSVEIAIDDVLRPGVMGASASARLASVFELFGSGVSDRRARRFGADGVTVRRTTIEGLALGADLVSTRAGRHRVGLRVTGQLLGSASGVGLGSQAELTGRLRLGGRGRTAVTTLGLDLGGGVAGPGFVFDLFGPTYPAHRVRASAALEGATDARGTVHGRAFARHGSWALHLGYGQALGPAAQPFDRRTRVAVELGGLSLGGGRVLSLQLGHASRGLFDASEVHALAASARLRLHRWIGLEAYSAWGETFEAGGGLSVTWVP